MIDIALSSRQARDPKIRKLVGTIKRGEADATSGPYALLLGGISDDRTRRLLADNANGDPNAPGLLLSHLKSRMDTLVETHLYPHATADLTEAKANRVWSVLTEEIRLAAQRLWRDDFIGDASKREANQRLRGRGMTGRDDVLAEQSHLNVLTVHARLLMLLWVEASLYRLRAISNFRAGGAQAYGRQRKFSMRARIGDLIQSYRRSMSRWDRAIRRRTSLHMFLAQYGDGERFKDLSKAFGPTTLRDGEKGWVGQVLDAQLELRYHAFDARLAEMRRSRRPLAALGLLLLRSTGYGTRPTRFLRMVLLIIAIFAGLFAMSDYLHSGLFSTDHSCFLRETSGLSWPEVGIRYLYLAVATLTSHGPEGTAASYCGGALPEVLVALGSLTGYFLLAIVAALVVERLMETEG
ncbi:MAG: hypothetical protein IVW57_15565 [Ktedonobacterales bacterium]|nr:hypothetical protein [Ktedonobacterales bacterium]